MLVLITSHASHVFLLLAACVTITISTPATFFEKELLLVKDSTETKANLQDWILSQMNNQWGWENGNSPRSVIAMSLSNDSWFNCHDASSQLIQKQLQLDLAKMFLKRHKQSFTSGQLALYVNALIAVCSDPHDFLGINLLSKLKHMHVVSEYERALVLLTLCNAGHHLSEKQIHDLYSILSSHNDSINELDTLAMAVITLSCANQHFQHSQISDNLYKPLKAFKKLQNNDGSFGNLYTTALVVQALIAARDRGEGWKFARTLKYINSHFRVPSSSINFLLQFLILPVLNGKSLAHLKERTCNCEEETIDGAEQKDQNNDIEFILNLNHTSITDPVQHTFASNITSENIIILSLWTDPEVATGHDQNSSIVVHFNEGDSFLDVVNKASNVDSKYKFILRDTSIGPYIESISGIANNIVKKKFWRIYVFNKELKLSDKGIGDIEPKNGDHYVFWYQNSM